jgi:UDP-glucose 4-epimerase
MRVVVTGATGNVGSRVVARLASDERVHQIVGVVRRVPDHGWPPKMRWVGCDIGAPSAIDALGEATRNADAVVHCAWQIHPVRDLDRIRRTNVDGSRRVFAAAAASAASTLVYLSSVGTYSPGPKDRQVGEDWAREGIPTSAYSRHKVEAERLLDAVEQTDDAPRCVRLRPGLIFQAAGSEIARYFLGPFVPLSALRRRLLPAIPVFDRLAFQAVHTDDVAAAVLSALFTPTAQGAYNLAARPVIDGDLLATTLGVRPVPTPLPVLRAAVEASYRARLHPTDAGWIDLAAAVPLMATGRAVAELGWRPAHTSTEALLEMLDGMAHGIGGPSPVLREPPGALGRAVRAARTVARGGAGARE